MRLMLSMLATLVFVGCAAPGTRFWHSKTPVDLGGGQFLVEGYKLETGLERAREHCGAREAVTKYIMRPTHEFEWTKIVFVCR